MEHEASTSKIGEDQIFYCKQRGISTEDAVSMIVNGFCKEVFRELPMEFAVEAQKLLGVSAWRGASGRWRRRTANRGPRRERSDRDVNANGDRMALLEIRESARRRSTATGDPAGAST